MSVLDKLLDAVKLNDDDYDDDDFLDDDLLDGDDEDFLDEDTEKKPMSKFLKKFGHKKSGADDDLDDFLDDEPVKSPVKRAARETSAAKTITVKTEKPARAGASSKITPMRSSRKNSSASPSMEVCVIKPTSMEDAREIADTLVDNCTVVLNLEGIDMNLAQRIFDFASGACYALDGTVQEVSTYIILLGPSNVNITGDMKNILAGSAASARAGY